MKNVILALAILAISASAIVAEPKATPFEVAMLCNKTGQRISGRNKICFYNCAGSEAATTVKSYKTCPISIDL
jgi:hypothetical protein